jgi:hypothetical protein
MPVRQMTKGGSERNSPKPHYAAGDKAVFPSGESCTVIKVHGGTYEVLMDSPKGVVATVPFEKLPAPKHSEARLWKEAIVGTHQEQEAAKTATPLDKDQKWGVFLVVVFLLLWGVFSVL